jgi:branched-chain amino acid transport system ATP-binding protein
VIAQQRASAGPELSVEHIAVRFGGLVAIADLHFSIAPREIVALIGANGAGKTTAFNVITGFQRPTSGRVEHRGEALTGLRPHQIASRGVARTFQRTSVFPNHTVLDNALIGLHRKGRATLWDTLLTLPRAKAEERRLRDRAMGVLDVVGIAGRAADLGGSLPYGDQRLLGVALALASDPSMLLLDEPVSGMNASEKSTFMKLLDRLRASGMTLLLVEHDMRMVMGISDRVVVLNQGHVIADGAPSEIQRHPGVIRAYLGRSASRA